MTSKSFAPPRWLSAYDARNRAVGRSILDGEGSGLFLAPSARSERLAHAVDVDRRRLSISEPSSIEGVGDGRSPAPLLALDILVVPPHKLGTADGEGEPGTGSWLPRLSVLSVLRCGVTGSGGKGAWIRCEERGGASLSLRLRSKGESECEAEDLSGLSPYGFDLFVPNRQACIRHSAACAVRMTPSGTYRSHLYPDSMDGLTQGASRWTGPTMRSWCVRQDAIA